MDNTTTDFGLAYVPDIDFAEKDPAVIVTEVIADYEAAFNTLTGIAKRLAPGDPVRLFLLVVCHWLSHQRTIIDFTGKMNLLKYARDSYLDNLAALYGDRALRLQAQPATTTLRFTLTAPLATHATIPGGTLCQAPNGVVFETVADATIQSALLYVDVDATAIAAGTVGNGFAPGQITSIINWNQPFGVSVTNTVPTTGGSDPETDEQYRYRIWLAIESFSTCGPSEAYEFWALSAHPSIMQVVVHSAPAIAGEVWLYPLLRGGVLPAVDGSDNILALVQESCSRDDRRPVTDYVTAKRATQFVYTLNVDYYVLQSNAVLLGSIQAAVQQAALDWIEWQHSAIARDINGSELTRRMLEAGAKRVVINSPAPSFQVMNFDQLAVHDPNIDPIINFPANGLEEP